MGADKSFTVGVMEGIRTHSSFYGVLITCSALWCSLLIVTVFTNRFSALLQYEIVLAAVRAQVFAVLEYIFTGMVFLPHPAWYNRKTIIPGTFVFDKKVARTTWTQAILNGTVTIIPCALVWGLSSRMSVIGNSNSIEHFFQWVFVWSPLLYWTCEALQGYLVMCCTAPRWTNDIWRYPREKWFVLCHGNIRLDYVYVWWLCGALEWVVRQVVSRTYY